jgi:hypothetical protein
MYTDSPLQLLIPTMTTRHQRLSVPIPEQTLEIFKRISAASGVSVGKSVASWLYDTQDAAEYMAQKMDAARQSPRIVARELHSYAAGLAIAGDRVIAAAAGDLPPRHSNTGGKVSEKVIRPKLPRAKKTVSGIKK